MAENSKSKKEVKNPNEEEQIVFDTLDESLNTGVSFIEKHLSKILIALGVLAALIIGYICIDNFVCKPKEAEAKESISGAQALFAEDLFEEALNGNDSVVGFLEIIDQYGSTDAGNLANAYAGLCYKQLGDNQNAIKYLEDFKADEKFVQPAIQGAIGNAYWDMDNAEKAISYYKKAASVENGMMTPFYNKRAALAYMSIEKYAEALKLLESIEKQYPDFSEIDEVKKLIEYAKAANVK